MKKIILILASLVITQTHAFAASEAEKAKCALRIREEMQVIDDGQELIKRLERKGDKVNSYDVTVFQKNLTHRYASLKSFMTFYEDDRSNCGSVLPSKAIAIYDFTVFGELVLENPIFRRMVASFTKYEEFGLTDFIKAYKKYTSDSYIKKIHEALSEEINNTPGEYAPEEESVRKPFYPVADKALKVAGVALEGIAKVWGFLSDHLRWRQGHLKDNKEALDLLTQNLKPLDLIFEKKKFVLSNYTIPGNWGHVAIWLGTKEELQRLGVWDRPYFAPFKEQVLAGKSIVEIRKKGVNYQSLTEFMNLDEVAVTRVNRALKNADSIFRELTEQIKKDYDFQFDAYSLNKITCAELVAFSYGNINWPREKTLYTTIRPDDIASPSSKKDSFETFLLYLVGNKDKSFTSVDEKDWAKLFVPKK